MTRKNIDWMSIERVCAEDKTLPDCVPSNAREWDVFIRQYERAEDLAEGRWEPHYDWETEEEFNKSVDEFNKSVDEQFCLGGYKKSIYECFVDLALRQKDLFHGVNWQVVNIARRFTTVNVSVMDMKLPKLPKLPRRVVGSFFCHRNKLTSLQGAPNWVGKDFWCHDNLLTSLEGAPNWVGRDFRCDGNPLTSLEGAPNWVGGVMHVGLTVDYEVHYQSVREKHLRE